MPVSFDETIPLDGPDVSKADLRSRYSALKQAVNHGGFVQNPVTTVESTGTQALASLKVAIDQANALPAGGTTNQVLAKIDDDDYNAQWITFNPGASSFIYDVVADGGVERHDTEAAARAGVDQTAAIKAAVAAAIAARKWIYFPPGYYATIPTINALVNANVTIDITANNVRIQGYGAYLVNNRGFTGDSSMVRADDKHNIIIHGLGCIGNLTDSTTKNEGSHGFEFRGCTNLVMVDTHARLCWGDGIYFGVSAAPASAPCVGFRIENHHSKENLRQGLSIIEGMHGWVIGGIYEDTGWINGVRLELARRQPPEAGIDFEPNAADAEMRGVRFIGVSFVRNGGAGLSVAPLPNTTAAPPALVWITNPFTKGNRQGIVINKARTGARVRVAITGHHSHDELRAAFEMFNNEHASVRVTYDDPFIVNPCTDADPGAGEDRASAMLVWGNLATGAEYNSDTIGGLSIRNPSVIDDRGAGVKVLHALALQNIGANSAGVHDVRLDGFAELVGVTPQEAIFLEGGRGSVRAAGSLKAVCYSFSGTHARTSERFHPVVKSSGAGVCTYELPDLLQQDGTARVELIHAGTGTLRIDPAATDLIAGHGAAGKYIETTEQWASVLLEMQNDNMSWRVISKVGAWTVEP